jgi:hypothetical protein
MENINEGMNRIEKNIIKRMDRVEERKGRADYKRTSANSMKI